MPGRFHEFVRPVLGSVLLHVALVGAIVGAAFVSLPERQPQVRTIQAYIAREPVADARALPQPVERTVPPESVPEPAREPTPTPAPEPDPAELQRAREAERLAAEQAAREAEQRRTAEAEQRRAEREAVQAREAAEAKRRADAEAKLAAERRAQEETEARRRAEAAEAAKRAEAEKRRAEAEAKRRAEAEARRRAEAAEAQKRAEAEKRRAAEESERRAREAALERQLAAEDQRARAAGAGLLERYIADIQARIERAWNRPPTARPGLRCIVNVTQVPGGTVTDVSIGECNGDAAVRQSIVFAVYRASPLPAPPDPSLFERNLRLVFEPDV